MELGFAVGAVEADDLRLARSHACLPDPDQMSIVRQLGSD